MYNQYNQDKSSLSSNVSHKIHRFYYIFSDLLSLMTAWSGHMLVT